jgi:hypothetical protein
MFLVSDYRDHAARWLRWACGPGSGYAESHVIYQRVTEGRDKPPWPNKYSSCGDLAHGLYEQLGVRLPWVNRAALKQYRERKNISLLAYSPLARDPRPGERFEAGDVLIVWDIVTGPGATSDAHAIAVLDEFPEQGCILTAEYGQPGGAIRTSGIERDKDGTRIRGRTVRRVLSLESVLEAAEDAGLLVSVDYEGNPLPTGDAS